ncbi:putative dehydrogenase [Roseimicrobium gellanilyticum]|uniref:Putative dehydrogenase n=1 Tax=Roseimicrobium gellanilyticum TaxID=748857 RepID=A0A366H1T4_9BACT|nr:Gfo/Idh/MocA family oxidoreductase [Roseimicrobium gellanilyticum]RBP35192.1 putative dehydrogenase [Roseimicrobium gellanilyticum]
MKLKFRHLPLLILAATLPLQAEDPKPLKVGIIGLDTSHAIAFTTALNKGSKKPEDAAKLAGAKLIAAYPKGSPDIESSTKRVPEYTAKVQEMGVEIVDTIDDLVSKVDAVLLETNDGRPHLEQVRPVLKAKKPVFIDKPIAASLADAIRIFDEAKAAGVPIFSASSLRYGKGTQEVRNGSIGKVKTAETFSPVSLEPTHPDLFWYGIHGVESLFTVMGTGCQSVKRGTTADGKIEVIGTWEGGRTGIFRESKDKKNAYGGKAVGEKGEAEVGKYDGYDPLLVAAIEMFRSGKAPVSAEETLEIYAFMEAADESKRRNGAEVTLKEVMDKARAEIAAKK